MDLWYDRSFDGKGKYHHTLATMTCTVGTNLHELHSSNEWVSNDFINNK